MPPIRTALASLGLGLALLAQTLAHPSPLHGAETLAKPDARLRELEREMKKGEAERQRIREKAAALTAETGQIKSDMIGAARAVQEREEMLSELEGQLHGLGTLEQEKREALDLKRQQLNSVLGAMQRLAFRPSEALIAQPTSPGDTVRSAILLRTVVPRITEQSADLKSEIEQLSSLRSDVARQKSKIAAAAAKLDGEHQRLAKLYERKQQLRHDVEDQGAESERNLAALANEASDLRDLLARIEEEQRRAEAEAARKAEEERLAREAQRRAAKAAREAEIAAAKAAKEAEIAAAKAAKEQRAAEERRAREAKAAEAKAREEAALAEARAAKAEEKERAKREAAAREARRPSFAQAQGQMPFPARGTVVGRFGQSDGVGQVSRGITLATRAGAQVIAPFDGKVVFAGPFRGYGLLLIIDHGEGYHTLLAGMARIDGSAGQTLVAGEPVGIMAQSEGTPHLYVELRQKGQPVNPLPWLTARKTRVNG